MFKLKHFIFLIYASGFFTHSQTHKQNSKEYYSTLHELKQNLQHAKDSKNTDEIAQTYLKLGDFFTELELYSEAIQNYQIFKDIHKNKDTSLVYVENELTRINLKLKKFKDAKKHAYKSLSISTEINYYKGTANVHGLLGSIDEKQGYYKNALKHQKTSLLSFQFLNDSTGLAITNDNIGSIYEDLEDFDSAYEYFKKAWLYSKNCNTNIQINIINNLGDINSKTGNFENAINYTNQALSLAKRTDNNSQIESAYKDLARTYSEIGNYEQAYNYLNHQSIVKEQELKQKNIEVVSTMEILYAVKEKEAELQLLNKQKQITEVRQHIILICTTSIILALILAFMYWKKRKKHEQHILEYQQQLLQVDLDKKTEQKAALQREIEIKVSSLTNYSLNIAHKNKILYDISKTLSKLKDRNIHLIKKKLKDIIKDIDTDLANQNEWTELMGYFSLIHPDFFKNLNQIASSPLSGSEIRLSMLLRLNLSSKDIANIIQITTDSVRIARYRLRKKLPINSKDDLLIFLLNL